MTSAFGSLASNIFLYWLKAIVSPVFFLLAVLIAWQYWFLLQSVGDRRRKLKLLARFSLISTGSGMFASILGSFLLVLTGVDVAETGVLWLWLLALILMLINPRFICFAYAGGMCGMMNLLFGRPAVDVPQLMTLVGVLHLVEAMLILAVGSKVVLPGPAGEQEQEREPTYILQQFWPLPLVAVMGSLGQQHVISFLNWWPIMGGPEDVPHVLLPVIAVLGYRDVTRKRSPVKKARTSAKNLLFYSLTLLGLALAGNWWAPLRWPAVLWAPLGHELVIWAGMKAEEKRN